MQFSNKLQIKKINSVIFHNNREYILFTVKKTSDEYIFFQNKSTNIRSLFYGSNFSERIPQILKDQKTECIECSLGHDIIGGISVDGDDQVEFGISVEDANILLDCLKKSQVLSNFCPPYFTLTNK